MYRGNVELINDFPSLSLDLVDTTFTIFLFYPPSIFDQFTQRIYTILFLLTSLDTLPPTHTSP